MPRLSRVSGFGLALAFLPLLLGATSAWGGGDAAKGEDLFATNCADCHTVTAGGKNKRGPNLFGIIGRHAGSIPDFEYSDANKNSNIIWTPDVLMAYLVNPRKYLPDTKMKFDGLPDAGERADVITFLETLK